VQAPDQPTIGESLSMSQHALFESDLIY